MRVLPLLALCMLLPMAGCLDDNDTDSAPAPTNDAATYDSVAIHDAIDLADGGTSHTWNFTVGGNATTATASIRLEPHDAMVWEERRTPRHCVLMKWQTEGSWGSTRSCGGSGAGGANVQIPPPQDGPKQLFGDSDMSAGYRVITVEVEGGPWTLAADIDVSYE